MKIELVHGDCLELLHKLPESHQRGPDVQTTIFMDPPDNIGLKYEGDYRGDRRPDPDYYNWLELILNLALRKCSIFWISYFWKHDLEIKWMVRDLLKYRYLAWDYRQFLWRFTFSQYDPKDCTVGFRHILRLKSPVAKLNVQDIKVDSVRMLIGDSRAAGPRVPDSVWDYPRVVGNAAERRAWHPTQHPQALMERIVAMSCPGPSDIFIDLFEGSGTSLRACKLLQKNHIGCELSSTYIAELEKEHQIKARPVILESVA